MWDCTILRYTVASDRLVPSSLLSGEEDYMGELIGLARCILVRCKMSEMYFCWESVRLTTIFSTSTPKKKPKKPKYLTGNLVESFYMSSSTATEDEPVRIMSSTYTKAKSWNLSDLNMKRELFDFEPVNPISRRKLLNLEYQARGACLRPYIIFRSLYTAWGCLGCGKPGGWAMYIVSDK